MARAGASAAPAGLGWTRAAVAGETCAPAAGAQSDLAARIGLGRANRTTADAAAQGWTQRSSIDQRTPQPRAASQGGWGTPRGPLPRQGFATWGQLPTSQPRALPRGRASSRCPAGAASPGPPHQVHLSGGAWAHQPRKRRRPRRWGERSAHFGGGGLGASAQLSASVASGGSGPERPSGAGTSWARCRSSPFCPAPLRPAKPRAGKRSGLLTLRYRIR